MHDDDEDRHHDEDKKEDDYIMITVKIYDYGDFSFNHKDVCL